MDQDHEILAARFASRVQLCKMTEEQVIADALKEHKASIAWAKSPAQKEGSFLWYCEEFDLEPSAVRRAIEERRK